MHSIPSVATAYRKHGAAAVSVLTDRDFFQGSLEYLAQVKREVGLPCLNKEFMVRDIQFYEAGPMEPMPCSSLLRLSSGGI